MKGWIGRLGIAAILAAGAASGIISAAQGQTQTPPPQRTPVFRAGANFVLVDAYPQRDGKIVEGLTPSDFEVLEDGKVQAVDSLEFVRIEPTPTSERRDPNNTREMLQLAADPHNRVFVVFLDGLHTTLDGSRGIRGPLVNALNRIIGQNDLFGVTTHLLRPRDLVLGRRLESVQDQLTRYWPWGERQRTSSDPNDPAEDSLKQCFEYTPGPDPKRWLVDDGAVQRDLYKVLIERRREDRVLTSLNDMLEHLATIREARTTLLLISDGWLLLKENRALIEAGALIASQSTPGIYIGPSGRPTTAPSIERQADYSNCFGELTRLASLDNEQRFRDMLRAANRANVSFYPIAASGLAAFDTTLAEDTVLNPRAQPLETTLGREFNRVRDRVQNLRTLAENTDGIAVVSTNDIAGGLKRVVDDLSAYYLLGYYSTNQKFDGKLRRIEVKVKQSGVNVRARRGYLAPTEAMLSAPTGASRPPAGSDSVPIDDALGVLARLRPGADLYTHGVVHAGQLQIAVEISSRAIEQGRWAQGGAVHIDVGGSGATKTTASGTIEPGARGALIHVPGVSGDGPWQVAVRVTGTGGGDPIDDRFEIRAPTSTLLGAALLYRGTPSPRSPLRAVADFQFRRTERAHFEWPILQPLDNRSARLLDRKGQPLPIPVTLTERPGEKLATLVADVQLAPLTDGEYVVDVSASRGGVTERALVALRVIR